MHLLPVTCVADLNLHMPLVPQTPSAFRHADDAAQVGHGIMAPLLLQVRHKAADVWDLEPSLGAGVPAIHWLTNAWEHAQIVVCGSSWTPKLPHCSSHQCLAMYNATETGSRTHMLQGRRV